MALIFALPLRFFEPIELPSLVRRQELKSSNRRVSGSYARWRQRGGMMLLTMPNMRVAQRGAEAMPDIDFADLTRYAKAMANLTSEQERLVLEAGALLKPLLGEVTEAFYEKLMAVPEANKFLDGRVEHLKKAHRAWLEQVFTGPHDEAYTAYLYKVGDIHVRVNLPVEFMAAGVALISAALRAQVSALYGGECRRCGDTMGAIDSVLSYSLIVMQNSYQGSMEAQLEKFLRITGITRALYGNMARAYIG